MGTAISDINGSPTGGVAVGWSADHPTPGSRLKEGRGPSALPRSRVRTLGPDPAGSLEEGLADGQGAVSPGRSGEILAATNGRGVLE